MATSGVFAVFAVTPCEAGQAPQSRLLPCVCAWRTMAFAFWFRGAGGREYRPVVLFFLPHLAGSEEQTTRMRANKNRKDGRRHILSRRRWSTVVLPSHE